MAYNPKNLSVLAYNNGFTLWHYRTTDQLCDVLAPGYFAPATDMLRSGDMILVNTANAAGILVFNGIVDGEIDVRSLADTENRIAPRNFLPREWRA